jgi:hypothetical protein
MGKFTLAPLAIVLLLVMVACGEAAAPAAPAASEPVVVEVTKLKPR